MIARALRAVSATALMTLTLVAVSAGQPPTASPASPQEQAQAEVFETKIRPVLATNCYGCHAEDRAGGLRLDSRDGMLKGGRSGQPAVVPGDPDKSRMIQAVRQTGALKMPKGGKLAPEEVDALTEWVKAGAIWPSAAASPITTASAASAAATGATTDGGTPAPATPKAPAYVISAERRAFWSFQPIRRPEVPAVGNSSWAKGNIDRFILARLEKDGLTPVKPAERLALIRRATLDLTGLPPSLEEIEAFEHDDSPDAFTKVVDRLLASPRYGESWGRMWLDVARYGEDDYRSLDPMRRGYNPYPNAYLYRDWVIKALNDDMPYDLFVKSQLAGDLLDESVRVKTLPGLGFLGLGPWFYDNGAVEITRADERHDRVDVVSRGFLGLTVGCARCHDHKYD
ncbi:MAG TPA: DUF1549 domain-containing protein, partial [Vicinamibacterales bacterium]|nr:DUF1549 domain-containing protein [Vicinamibacterales bacterium]